MDFCDFWPSGRHISSYQSLLLVLTLGWMCWGSVEFTLWNKSMKNAPKMVQKRRENEVISIPSFMTYTIDLYLKICGNQIHFAMENR